MNDHNDVYRKVFGVNFDIDTYNAVLAKAVELYPITSDMAPEQKKANAVNRVKVLSDAKALPYELSMTVLEYFFEVPPEEVDRVSF